MPTVNGVWHDTEVTFVDRMGHDDLNFCVTCTVCGIVGHYGSQRQADLRARLHRAGLDSIDEAAALLGKHQWNAVTGECLCRSQAQPHMRHLAEVLAEAGLLA